MDRHILQAKLGRNIPTKTIYLIRHGQSTHNAQAFQHTGASYNDACYIDAHLTDRGQQQARDLVPKLRNIAPQLIVTSPLTRAIQTFYIACAALNPANVSVYVNPLCTECVCSSCDIGSPLPELHRRFPNLDFSPVASQPHFWWTDPNDPHPKSPQRSLSLLHERPRSPFRADEPRASVQHRANNFRLWLLQRPETSIAVFAHGIFLKVFDNDSEPFYNCEIRKVSI